MRANTTPSIAPAFEERLKGRAEGQLFVETCLNREGKKRADEAVL
ncbi:hypothetical protein [uncultured Marivirga sp.]